MSRYLPYTLDDMVDSGEVARVAPSIESGSRAYNFGGRLFAPAGAEAISRLRYGIVPCGTNAGTLAFRIRPTWDSTDTTTRNLLVCRSSSAGIFYVMWLTPGKFRAAIYDGSTTKTNEITPAAFSVGKEFAIVARFDADSLQLSIAGETQPAETAHILTLPAAIGLDIGQGAGVASAGAYISSVYSSQQCQSDAWRDAALSGGGAALLDQPQFASRYMSATTDFFAPLVSNSRGYVRRRAIVPFAEYGQVVADGDSIVSGLYTTGSHAFVTQAAAALGSTEVVTNLANPGDTWAEMQANASTTVDVLYDAKRRHNILICQAGVNDIFGAGTAATCITNMQTYLTARKAVGWKIVLGCLTPCSLEGTAADFNTKKATVNAWIAANWQDYADAWADFTADPYIGVDGCETDTDYWYNLSHWNDGGHDVAATYFIDAVRSVI